MAETIGDMPYSKPRFSRESPGLILLLVDQSAPLDSPSGGRVEMKTTAAVVNDCIYEIVVGCTEGNHVRDRCQLALITYGDGATSVLFAGWVSEVAQKMEGQGGWLVPKAAGDSPVHRAFDEAARLIRDGWLIEYPDSFPPLVLGISHSVPTADGKSDFIEAAAAAKRLTTLKTGDGNVLLFNAHLSPDNRHEMVLPANLSASAGELARLLFTISSPIPEPMISLARGAGLNPSPGSRGCLCNAGTDALAKLMSFAATLAARRVHIES